MSLHETYLDSSVQVARYTFYLIHSNSQWILLVKQLKIQTFRNTSYICRRIFFGGYLLQLQTNYRYFQTILTSFKKTLLNTIVFCLILHRNNYETLFLNYFNKITPACLKCKCNWGANSPLIKTSNYDILSGTFVLLRIKPGL